MAGRFITVDEALALLKIDKSDFDELVKKRGLRQIRDGGTIKFYQEEIDKLQADLAEETPVSSDDNLVAVENALASDADDASAELNLEELVEEDSTDEIIVEAEETPPSSASEVALVDSARDEHTDEIDLGDLGLDEDIDDSDQTSVLPLEAEPSAPTPAPEGEEQKEDAIFDFDDVDLGIELEELAEETPVSDTHLGDESGSDAQLVVTDETPAGATPTDTPTDTPTGQKEKSDLTTNILDAQEAGPDAMETIELEEFGAEAGEGEIAADEFDILEEAEAGDTADVVAETADVGEEQLETVDVGTEAEIVETEGVEEVEELEEILAEPAAAPVAVAAPAASSPIVTLLLLLTLVVMVAGGLALVDVAFNRYAADSPGNFLADNLSFVTDLFDQAIGES